MLFSSVGSSVGRLTWQPGKSNKLLIFYQINSFKKLDRILLKFAIVGFYVVDQLVIARYFALT